jgi:hypothetical protein
VIEAQGSATLGYVFAIGQVFGIHRASSGRASAPAWSYEEAPSKARRRLLDGNQGGSPAANRR